LPKRGDVTKKEIERYLQGLAANLGRVPVEADVIEDRPGLLREIDRNYPNRGAAFKRAKIGLCRAGSETTVDLLSASVCSLLLDWATSPSYHL
jgi:hypothetical protein